MPPTRFPNGVSASTVEQSSLPANGDGNFYGDVFVGQVVTMPIMFSSASTAQIVPAPAPFAGDIIGAFVTVGSVSAVSAAYTVQVGSAGSIAVASVANSVTTSYAREALALTTTGLTTANGIKVTRGVQGTAGETTLTLLLKRTS